MRRIGLSQFGLTTIPGRHAAVRARAASCCRSISTIATRRSRRSKSLGGVNFTYAVRTAAGPNPARVAEVVPAGTTEGGAAARARHAVGRRAAHSGADPRPDSADGIRLRRRHGRSVRQADRSDLRSDRRGRHRGRRRGHGAAAARARGARRSSSTARDAANPGFSDIVRALVQRTWGAPRAADGYGRAIQEAVAEPRRRSG